MARDMSVGRFFSGPNAFMVTALSAATIILLSAAVIGGRDASDSARGITPAERAAQRTSDSSARDAGGDGQDAAPGTTPGTDPGSAPGTSAPGTRGGASTGGGGGGPGGGGGGGGELPSQPGATRTGVHQDHFEFGAHAPITFDGQPLNLAEDPIIGLKGYITHLNRQGGINGRKIRLFLEDDRYTTTGGQQAADRLVKEVKPFLIEGTLGIDQIEKVARAAQQAGIPYMAGGGPEPEFKGLMYQIISNYDQYANMIVDFICKRGKEYVNDPTDEIRLGTTTLDSAFIKPVEARFVDKIQKANCVVPVDNKARGTIDKPTEQSTYQGQLLDLRNSYNGKGANLIVPFQDPISTARQVGELRAYKGQGYNPKWTFANFAHDSDTVLSLMAGEWAGVQGMSGGCYYHPSGNPNAYNPNFCMRMTDAHQQWAALGPVKFDENAGGCAGGKCEYNYNEDSWAADGSGGASGYQLVYFWHGAMNSIGTDPTREKLVAALNAYENYSNLLTGPITFKGSPNTMVGATKFSLLEGQSNQKFKQLTPGLIDQF